jgi:hypothetical protein
MTIGPDAPARLRGDAPFDRIRDDGLFVRLRPITPEDRERIHRRRLAAEEARDPVFLHPLV